MKKTVDELLLIEFESLKKSFTKKNHEECVYHFGRAHIIAQRSLGLHLFVHFAMLCYSLRLFHFKEVFAQTLRLFVTIPGHAFGKIPTGNTGWSSAGLTKKMAVPKDLEHLF